MEAQPSPESPVQPPPAQARERGCLFYGSVVMIALVVVVGITTLVTLWWVDSQINAKPFTPVSLSQVEQQVLDEKLESVGGGGGVVVNEGVVLESGMPVPETTEDRIPDRPQDLHPEEEERGRRLIKITERELNGMLHHRTGLAERLKIELRNDRVFARANIPMDEDVPGVGGRTIRVTLKLGLEVDPESRSLEVVIQELLIAGISMPDAWIGGLKGTDLVNDFVTGQPLLESLVEGIEDLRVDNGVLHLLLAE